MRYLENEWYRKDVETAVKHAIGFEAFAGKGVLVLGASGLIGSFLVDCFLYANETFGTQTELYAGSRNIKHLRERFGTERDGNLHFVEADVTDLNIRQTFDYIIHGAGYGHPKAFRENPVEVLLTNVAGTQKVLELAKGCRNCRVLYISSGEVQEQVDHLSARACYPIGKKAAETLCVSYIEEYGSDVVIARPGHTFGPNITKKDNRATAQFLASAARGARIDMYSAGSQERTFSYVADCVSGLLTVLVCGKSKRVYGVSSGESCTIKEFAETCAAVGNCRIGLHVPTKAEQSESSPIARQLVENKELRGLGWQPAFSIGEGIRRTVQIMREVGEGGDGNVLHKKPDR